MLDSGCCFKLVGQLCRPFAMEQSCLLAINRRRIQVARLPSVPPIAALPIHLLDLPSDTADGLNLRVHILVHLKQGKVSARWPKTDRTKCSIFSLYV